VITAKDGRGIVEGPVTRKFVVPSYVTLDPANAVTGVDTSKPGFLVRVHQTKLRDQANTVARAERQLHGDLGPSVLDTTTVFEETTTINYSQPDAFGTGGTDPVAGGVRAAGTRPR